MRLGWTGWTWDVDVQGFAEALLTTAGLTPEPKLRAQKAGRPRTNADTGPPIDKGIATNVHNMGWTTVENLDHTYTNMVVIATPNYDKNQVPLVTRIQNAGGDSFQVRVDRADGLTGDIGGVNVHYMVLEAGVYTMADDGVKMDVGVVSRALRPA